ncbi:hypothetical protein D3C81_1457100 [compost metagenome]
MFAQHRVLQRPDLLGAGVQPPGAGGQHDVLQEAAVADEAGALEAAVHGEDQADRRVEEAELALDIAPAPGLVAARHALGIAELAAERVEARRIGFVQRLGEERVLRLQVLGVGPVCSHRGVDEPVARAADGDVAAPRLRIAGARRVARHG